MSEDQTAANTDNGKRVLDSLELTSIIFQSLKDIAIQEEGISTRIDAIPVFPSSWTAPWARLALVNRAFFHASTGVLWEHLSSFDPLFRLLCPPETSDFGDTIYPEQNLSAISAKTWDRFSFYSSKTRTLAFTKTALSPHPIPLPWIFQISNSKNRPDPLFPALARLFVNSDDDLSLFITFSIAHLVKCVLVDLGERSSSAAITTHLRQSESCTTKFLRIAQPSNALVLGNVAQIASLNGLELTISGLQGAQLWQLESLQCLEWFRLTIFVHPEPDDVQDFFPFLTASQAPVIRKTSLPTLVSFVVVAGGLDHLRLSASMVLGNLNSLQMEVLTPSEQSILAPLAATAYAKGNLSLKRFTLMAPRDIHMSPRAVEPARGDAKYSDYGEFLSSLAALHNMTFFRILHIPFFEFDIQHRLLDVASRFPQLLTLSLQPRAVTRRPADALETVGLQALANLSTKCPCLTDIGIYLDFSDIPNIADGCTPMLKVKGIFFRASLKKLGLEEWPSGEKLRLAQYLHRMFPQLNELATGWLKDSRDWKHWKEIEQLLSFSRDIRAQTIQELANARTDACATASNMRHPFRNLPAAGL
ncbi:hypothetical protein DFP72DRAFT_923681 [Ephemerocybe angulata]|uniref:Uncharacterized protein n=1 Tax=Ephemerocybe angulata TaxID=980116 RepID=A0A8H6LVZ5_9AGAR|nr:hypothetical protein DFP72DRAFT_923681 [Tulosesus angulatus]